MKKLQKSYTGGGVNRTLALLLCLLMLVAMLPVMTVPAYAAIKTVHLPEDLYSENKDGKVIVVYRNVLTGEDLLSRTELHYEDLDEGQYSVNIPTITGYYVDSIAAFRSSEKGAYIDDVSTINGTLSGNTSWDVYLVIYKNVKMDNGYIKINGYTDENASDPSWTELYYYDDMINGEYAIDLNRAGYQISGILSYSGFDGPMILDSGHFFTGTLEQGNAYKINVLYEPDISTASFNSVLLLNENSSVPNATINYSIAPGTGIAAVPGTSMAVLAPSADTGVTGTPTISNAVFALGDATVTSVDGVTIDADEKAVVKPISVDFSGVTFAQPGIFRYVITEPSSGNNMTYDTQLNDTTNGTRYQRVLDVYVIRNAEDEYEIGGFVLHEVAGAVNEGETTAADKSSGFVNEYNTTGLTLECQVEGNQSSIDKYFAYTITMQNPGNSAFNVAADWANASGAQNPVANPATSYTNEVITAANTNEWTSNADGSLSKTIYLKDGQKVALDGIPVGTAYSITVAEEDYGPSWVVKGYSRDVEVGGYDTLASGTNDATGNRSLGDTEDVIFTLVREGVVPTGVALSILPGVILMGAAAAFFFVMKNRKREEASEA